MMRSLEIEIVLPPRSEQKVDTRKRNEAESKEKEKDEASCKQQTNEAESKEKKKDEIQVEEKEEAGRKQVEKIGMVSSVKKKPHKVEGQFENMMELNVVVATFIATATFAAALAMPGGYNDQGRPVLYGSKEFKLFLAYDQAAFLLSVALLLLHFFTMRFREIFPVALSSFLIGFSLYMMVVAFAHGITAVIPRTENANGYYQTGDSITLWFVYFSLLLVCPPLFWPMLSAIRRRFDPWNSVRSRFGLWS